MNKWLWSSALLLTGLAWSQQETVPARSDEPDLFSKFSGRFLHEAKPDPLHSKFEELFGEPFPDKGIPVLRKFQPFRDVQQFETAVQRHASGLRTELQSMERSLILLVEVPGLEDKKVEVSINRERIRLSYRARQAPGPYRIAKATDQEIPLPEGADPDSAVVDRRGERLRITFRRGD
ncbi:MAG: hypothetical protein HY549_11480 [Elusimicrobia bacterium]|nr:hypothetical protein [Elusimicrobiota bacterium]